MLQNRFNRIKKSLIYYYFFFKYYILLCCKFSPGNKYVLIGCGVREKPANTSHPVVSIYEPCIGEGMIHSNTITNKDDDVNIARFHPWLGFVYGTMEGKIRVICPQRKVKKGDEDGAEKLDRESGVGGGFGFGCVS